jgi:CRISPR-associated protein Cst2
MSNLNLFATVLTYPAPASNYRGESEENRSVIQKILKDGQKYAIISPESMRNALREMLIELGQPNNRTRLHDEDQLAVEFKEYPNPDKFADDFLFGYMVAQTKDAKKMKELNRPAKRDSIFRCNMAVAVNPYKYDTVFYQSPLNAGDSTWKNSTSSALLHREVTHTAFQYPFALAGKDCAAKPEWVKALLQAIAELNGVAGGHARAYYEFAPRSVVARLTPKLVAGYQTYGFDAEGNWLELSRLTSADSESADLPAQEFWLGGELVREMDGEQKAQLEAMGTHLYANPEKLFADLADSFMGA